MAFGGDMLARIDGALFRGYPALRAQLESYNAAGADITRSAASFHAEICGRACPGCGYDLRGNTSGLCPECGRPMMEYYRPATSGCRLLARLGTRYPEVRDGWRRRPRARSARGAYLARLARENPGYWPRVHGYARQGIRVDEYIPVVDFRRASCRSCGYDLRGSLDMICPECGRCFDERPDHRRLRLLTALFMMGVANPDVDETVEGYVSTRRTRQRQRVGRTRAARREQALHRYLIAVRPPQ